MKKKTIIIISVFILVFILAILHIYKCPIKYIFGLSCPTCGLTRALLCALQFNFKKAFYYHMFWPVVPIGLIIYILYDYKIIKLSKKTMVILLFLVCILNLIYYFYRLLNGSDIVYFDFSKSLLYKIHK